MSMTSERKKKKKQTSENGTTALSICGTAWEEGLPWVRQSVVLRPAPVVLVPGQTSLAVITFAVQMSVPKSSFKEMDLEMFISFMCIL